MIFWDKTKKLINLIPGSAKLYRFIMRIISPDKVLGRPLNRGKCPPCDFSRLKTDYLRSPISAEPDTFVLYRIIGNDLPPRHLNGQSRNNIQFIIDNEPEFKGCEKRFVINRIIDPEEEKRIIEILKKARYPYIHIPFKQKEYLKLDWDTKGIPEEFAPGTPRFKKLRPDEQGRIHMQIYQHKNNYVMNNNGARNAALAQGRQLAKWVLPWDGNCFMTDGGWDKLLSSIKTSPESPYFIVPMARVTENKLLLRPDYEPEAIEEPQIIFRKDSTLSFNESYFYGRRPKVELLWKLGVPGSWDSWEQEPWDLPIPGYTEEAGSFKYAGWVARLTSGENCLEKDKVKRSSARIKAVKTMIDGIDRQLN